MAIRPDDHRPLLDKILSHYGLAPSSLEIVPDVRAWCRKRRMEGAEQATCYRDPDGVFRIAMVDMLTDEMIEGGKGAMESFEMASSVAALDTDVKYLVHLLMHEIAGEVLKTGEQIPRDRWAFEQLSKHV